jgi:serine protease AprX
VVRRGILLLVIGAALFAVALAMVLVSPFTAEAPDPGKSVKRGPAGPLLKKSDRDNDRVLDDLESRLAGKPASERVEVIVTTRERPSPELIRGLKGSVGAFDDGRRFSLIDAFVARMTEGQVRALARHPRVIQIEENSRVRALNNTAQVSFGVGEARADAPGIEGSADGDGNVSTYSKDDLVSAVIDTGIDAGHRDLDQGKVLGFRDFVAGRNDPYDDNGHGTHIAATIAGDGDARADDLYRGVAPGGALVGVKVLDATGGGTMADVIAGIEWVVQNREAYGIEVMNLSLGASGCADGTDAESLAVNAAHDAGLVVAVAAGNEGPGTCTIGSPGAATGALTVGAMADAGQAGFKQAYFSSRGKTGVGRIKPDISAPGVGITSAKSGTADGYVDEDGTSMATPFVAGVAMLMLDASSRLGCAADAPPSCIPSEVKSRLKATAVDWGRGDDNKTAGSSGADIDYGAGRLDAYAAIKAAGADLNSPPAVPEHRLREGRLSATGSQVDYRFQLADVRFPIAATLIIPAISGPSATSPDFDLYLFDPGGSRVAASEFSTRQEELGYKPTTVGTYTLRVKSYRGGGDYLLDISGEGALTRANEVSFPAASSIISGTLRSGDASRLGIDDNIYYQVNSTTSSTRVASWYGNFAGVANELTSLRVLYKGKYSRSCTQTLYIRRWSDSTWTLLDSRTVGTTEVQVEKTPTGTLANYVSGASGSGNLHLRVTCRTTSGSFYSSGDLMRIVYDRP